MSDDERRTLPPEPHDIGSLVAEFRAGMSEMRQVRAAQIATANQQHATSNHQHAAGLEFKTGCKSLERATVRLEGLEIVIEEARAAAAAANTFDERVGKVEGEVANTATWKRLTVGIIALALPTIGLGAAMLIRHDERISDVRDTTKDNAVTLRAMDKTVTRIETHATAIERDVDRFTATQTKANDEFRQDLRELERARPRR